MIKPIKSIAVSLFCLLTGGALLSSARAFDSEKMPASTVRIVSIFDDGSIASGSGFLVNQNGNIVTSEHVVHGATDIFALQRAGGVARLFRCKCDPSQHSEQLDLAVLTSSLKGSPLALNAAEPKPTSRVFAVGFSGIAGASDERIESEFFTAIFKSRNDPALVAGGLDLTRELSANSLFQQMVSPAFSVGVARRMAVLTLKTGNSPVKIVDCNINLRHGFSGGPLLDDAGLVIGVISTGFQGSDFEQVRGGIAESVLEQFLREHKVSFVTGKSR